MALRTLSEKIREIFEKECDNGEVTDIFVRRDAWEYVKDALYDKTMFAEIDDPCIPTYKGRTIHPLEIPDFNQSICFTHKEYKAEYFAEYRDEYKILSYYRIQDLLDLNELIPRDEEITFNEEEFNNILNGAV